MAQVGFIGLGNMGGPMVRNLIKAGHSLKVFDLSEEAINFAVQSGATAASSVKDAMNGIIMIPNTEPAMRALSELRPSILKKIPISRKKGPTVITAKNP